MDLAEQRGKCLRVGVPITAGVFDSVKPKAAALAVWRARGGVAITLTGHEPAGTGGPELTCADRIDGSLRLLGRIRPNLSIIF